MARFGVIDKHSRLKGLTDDDHTQYLNTARHDLQARHPYTVLPDNLAEQAASYVVFKENSTYKAKNCHTGAIDYSGTDASTVIQAALDGLTAGRTWKEKVIFKNDFTLTTQIKIPSYTVFKGGKFLASGITAHDDIIAVGTNITDVDIIGVKVDVNGLDSVGIGVNAIGTERITVQDCEVRNYGYFGGMVFGAKYGLVKHNLVDYGTGVYSTYARGIWLTSVNGRFITVEDNIILNSVKESIFVEDGCMDDKILNNYIYTPKHHGIVVGDAGVNPIEKHLVQGNTVYGSTEATGGIGIYLNKVKEVEVKDNHVYLMDGSGIAVTSSERCKIEDNFAFNNAQQKPASYDQGIRLDAVTYSTIARNHCFDNQTPKTQQHGIEFMGVANDYNCIFDNDLRDNANGNLVGTIGANTKIRNNYGFVTENSGTATILSGQTSVVFAHNLAGTPTFVVLGATHAEVSDAIWSADATNITLTVPSAVTANRNISWYAEYKP